MSPLYEYHCSTCGKNTERLLPFEGRDQVYCPNCGRRPEIKMSTFSFKLYNPFTKDGLGFNTVYMSKQEEKERIRGNALRDD